MLLESAIELVVEGGFDAAVALLLLTASVVFAGMALGVLLACDRSWRQGPSQERSAGADCVPRGHAVPARNEALPWGSGRASD
ncbi:hypothetical protein [Actinomyces sp. 565]|uniref:hypothetical protein n=1 Tax=Actinomyces sp. 565 TaxID=2057794 RepID=UPI0013A6E708|nr:hypothetical protein [Actinomyces sp. 565]NDR54666.1 hypothetical protein [Actinomyces sp. 565]